MRTHKPWCEAEIAIIRQCAPRMTSGQIGLLIGRTARAVDTKAQFEGIRLRKHGEYLQSAKYLRSDVVLARELHTAGVGPRAIADKLELPLSAVRQFVYFERRVLA